MSLYFSSMFVISMGDYLSKASGWVVSAYSYDKEAQLAISAYQSVM